MIRLGDPTSFVTPQYSGTHTACADSATKAASAHYHAAARARTSESLWEAAGYHQALARGFAYVAAGHRALGGLDFHLAAKCFELAARYGASGGPLLRTYADLLRDRYVALHRASKGSTDTFQVR
jgi:hypothetical protein